MEVTLNFTSNEESNIFLRALWAEFRQTFGKCAWQYAPFKDGKQNRIHFGFADIGLGGGDTLAISVSYKRKGVINCIFFDRIQGEIYEGLRTKLSNAVNQALERRKHLGNYYLQASFRSPQSAVAPYNGRFFSLRLVNKNENTNCLTLKVQGFDKKDAETEWQKLSGKILDFLAICTNSSFVFDSSENCSKEQTELSEEIFFQRLDWIEGYPQVEGLLRLWETQKDFIDRIVIGEIELDHPLLRASGHFHAAQKLWSENTHAMDRNSTFELANVLYVSALEVASELHPVRTKVCKECGQKVYSIRQRVKQLTRIHINEFIEKFIDDYYSTRSKYLHAGVLSSNTSYTGVSIPQLDPSSSSGCYTQISILPVNLREYVAYILRSIFRSMLT